MTVKPIVADSSYIVQGLLEDKSLFEGYLVFAPDYSLYEVINAVRKHESILKDIPTDSTTILATLFEFISSEAIQFKSISEATIRRSYALAIRTKTAFYDAVFILLAKELGVELKTLDKNQAEIYKRA